MAEVQSTQESRSRIAPGYAPTAEIIPVPWEDGSGVRITAVETILTAPDGVNLLIVRIRTSDDGLFGLGCATFTQRALAVKEVVDTYFAPRLIGRSVHEITDIAHSLTLDGYWRGGPILNSAISGVDQALWDIAGKLAGMPVWQLLGGRVRSRVPTYTHASGRDIEELGDQIDACIAAGYRTVRCQVTVPGTASYGAAQADRGHTTWDPDAYIRFLPGVFAELTDRYAGRVRFLHDIHERLAPADALRLMRALEPFDLFFVEDPVAPEDIGWLPRLRSSTSVPIAMGELLTNVNDYATMITDRTIDFVRCHVSALGGLTPAWRLAALAETFGVRTAWHGPRDVSPVGHAVSLAMDVASPAFGIHEHFEFSDETRMVFPGTPVTVDGSIRPSTAPGLGVTIDDSAAAAHPPVSATTNWHYSRVRRDDGALQRP